MKKNKKILQKSIFFITAFILWTTLICTIDVKAIGPNHSAVGLATLNSFIRNVTGVHLVLYHITDWLGLVPICFVLCFCILGLFQWIKRKSIKKVDYDLFMLGAFYIIVIAFYILFEYIVINYRPILINGYLEASYPSSTTLLVLCVMPTTMIQLNNRIKNKALKRLICLWITIFIIFMVVCRFISGVHWFSDIIGGVLLGTGLTTMYKYIIELK